MVYAFLLFEQIIHIFAYRVDFNAVRLFGVYTETRIIYLIYKISNEKNLSVCGGFAGYVFICVSLC